MLGTKQIVLLFLQLFKGAFYYCEGPDIKNVRNRTDCERNKENVWVNRKYNFDDLGKALMSLFVLSSRDGWVNIMYTGLDAVGVDQQVSTCLTVLTFKGISLLTH
jgi:voltage-dependent calcium channel T type alpha-1G